MSFITCSIAMLLARDSNFDNTALFALTESAIVRINSNGQVKEIAPNTNKFIRIAIDAKGGLFGLTVDQGADKSSRFATIWKFGEGTPASKVIQVPYQLNQQTNTDASCFGVDQQGLICLGMKYPDFYVRYQSNGVLMPKTDQGSSTIPPMFSNIDPRGSEAYYFAMRDGSDAFALINSNNESNVKPLWKGIDTPTRRATISSGEGFTVTGTSVAMVALDGTIGYLASGFSNLTAITTNDSDDIFVADAGNRSIIRIDKLGNKTLLATVSGSVKELTFGYSAIKATRPNAKYQIPQPRSPKLPPRPPKKIG